MELNEFEASLVYRASSRTTMVTQKNLDFKKQKQVNKATNKHINKKNKRKKKKVNVM